MSTNLSFVIYLVNLPRYLFLKKTSLFTSSLTSIRYTSFSWSIVLNRWRFCCCWATLDSRYDMCSSLSNSWKVGCLESEFSKFSRFLTTRRGFHWENEELLMFNYHGGAYYSNTFEKCFLLGILVVWKRYGTVTLIRYIGIVYMVLIIKLKMISQRCSV